MSTAALASRATTRQPYMVGFTPRQTCTAFVRVMREALALCPFTGKNGKRHEALYKPSGLHTALEKLVDELVKHGATAAQMEGLAQAIAGGIRAKVFAAMPPCPTLAEIMVREQRADGAEDIAQVACATMNTRGTRAAWRRALEASIAESYEAIRVLDAEDLRERA